MVMLDCRKALGGTGTASTTDVGDVLTALFWASLRSMDLLLLLLLVLSPLVGDLA